MADLIEHVLVSILRVVHHYSRLLVSQLVMCRNMMLGMQLLLV